MGFGIFWSGCSAQNSCSPSLWSWWGQSDPPQSAASVCAGTRGSCAPLLAPALRNAPQSPDRILSQQDTRGCHRGVVTVVLKQCLLHWWGFLCQNGGRDQSQRCSGGWSRSGAAGRASGDAIHQQSPSCRWPCPSLRVRSCHSIQFCVPCHSPQTKSP